jgi:glucokinase
MNSQNLIGIDIGATKIHLGLVQNGIMIEEVKLPTPANAPEEEVIAELIKGIEQLAGAGCSGIGIGVPGLVDEEKGIVYDLWNIPSWKEVFLKQKLEKHFNKPVHISNDANTFALGEKAYGQGKSFKNLVGVTLGSGFGTGIIIDHELYSGTLSSAGELAGIPYLDGNIEDYCSGKFFRKQFNLQGREVYALAQKGDAYALEIFKQYGKHLGNALNLILNILSPQAIFLGGSVSGSYAFFKEAMQERIQTFPFKRVSSQLLIAPSGIANVSILGAAALITMRHPSPEQAVPLP